MANLSLRRSITVLTTGGCVCVIALLVVSLHVQIRVPPSLSVQEPADVVAVVTQDRLVSDVRSGENRNRKLEHSTVVRSLTALGSLKAPGRTFETAAIVPIASDWIPGDLRIVGLLQERRSRRIVGAGSARVRAHGGPLSGVDSLGH